MEQLYLLQDEYKYFSLHHIFFFKKSCNNGTNAQAKFSLFVLKRQSKNTFPQRTEKSQGEHNLNKDGRQESRPLFVH